MTTNAKAYVIGDEQLGLTIVLTEPMVVIHYSIEELKNKTINGLYNENVLTSMAAVVRELVPMFRGVNVDDLNAQIADIKKSQHGTFKLAEEEAAQNEIAHANTIARIINAKGSVHDVNFCLAFNVGANDFAGRMRSLGPADTILNHINDRITKKDSPRLDPAKFPISPLSTGELKPLPPFSKPTVKQQTPQ